ncbi:hypothetical protein GUJ93_ZPchr0001g31989 [Zizania palustris]|uniref:Uncharacterized protein n=1 Tax=Zizania palustris TaxID=103762 RepID=A0A8J5RQR5_ZIZPA|nr:hypothetical protein GUJ93_ZPchr0001g31989 [Zizania palustris]
MHPTASPPALANPSAPRGGGGKRMREARGREAGRRGDGQSDEAAGTRREAKRWGRETAGARAGRGTRRGRGARGEGGVLLACAGERGG